MRYTKKNRFLHKNKASVFEYWERSAVRMSTEKRFPKLKDTLLFDHTWVTTVKALRDEGRIHNADRVLDVGCGWGRITFGLKFFQPHLTIIGLDANPLRLMAAREILNEYSLFENVTLITGDADNLNFSNDCFDSVVSSRLLQYVPNPVSTIRELHRVLKPGGYLVVTVPNKLNLIRYITYDKILYSPSSVKEWFSQCEFIDISCRSIGFLPTWKRVAWNSKLLVIERLCQNSAYLGNMGGLVLCSGKKRCD